MADRYCIDSSSLIEIKQRFPSDTFPSVWSRLSQLATSGRLFAPDEVLREIEKDLQLGPWAKSHRGMFRKPDAAQVTLTQQILGTFPKLVDASKQAAEADPFVIALAIEENRKQASLLNAGSKCLVVAEERRGSQNIRVACARYGVQCVDHMGLFRNEGWQF